MREAQPQPSGRRRGKYLKHAHVGRHGKEWAELDLRVWMHAVQWAGRPEHPGHPVETPGASSALYARRQRA